MLARWCAVSPLARTRYFEARWPELLEPAARCRHARGVGMLSEAATTVLKSTIRPEDAPFTIFPKVFSNVYIMVGTTGIRAAGQASS